MSASSHHSAVDPIRLGHFVSSAATSQSLAAGRSGREGEGIALGDLPDRTGRLGSLTLAKLRRVSDALDADLDVRLRWNGEGLDRLLDQAHAGLVEALVERLRALGWEVEVEASFSIAGERGSIDVAAFHRRSGIVLVAEVKSVVPDSQATIHGLDRKARLAPEVARARGWDCRGVARLLVVGDSSTSRRRIAQISATYGTAFPIVGWPVLRWLREPGAPISGLLFLPYARPANARTHTTGMQRVRLAGPARRGDHSRTQAPNAHKRPATTS